MGKKGKNKLPKDERPLKMKARRNDQLKSNPPSKPKSAAATKKYTLSSATKHISNININDEDVDDILKLLLELEMNEKCFDSIDAFVTSMMKSDEVGSIHENGEEDSESASDSNSDSESESERESESESESEIDSGSGSDRGSIRDRESSGDESGDESHEDDDEKAAEPATDTTAADLSEGTGLTNSDLLEASPPLPSSLPRDFVIPHSLKKNMKKRLIRDDRRNANIMKAKQFDEKVKQKSIKRERYEKEQLLLKQEQHQQQLQQRSGVKSKGKTPTKTNSNSAPDGPSSLESKLRIQVCSQKSKSSMKLMMLDRDKGWSVDELVSVIRTKLNEPKKFNAVMILPSKKAFEDEDIRFFENDTQLCLYIDSNKKVTKSSVSSKKTTSSGDSIKELKCKTDAKEISKVVETGEKEASTASQPPPAATLSFDSTSTASTNNPTIDMYSPICNDESRSALLRQEKEAMHAAPRYQSVQQGRANLPMFKAQAAFLSELQASENKTLIVVGDTG
jgi:hypothetical protein